MTDNKNDDVKTLASEAAKFSKLLDDGDWDRESVADPVVAEAEAAEPEPEAGDGEVPDAEIAEAMKAEFGDVLAAPAETAEPGLDGDATAAASEEAAFVKEEYHLPSELADAQAKSVIESILFASVHPVSFATLRGVFHGTNIDAEKLNSILNLLATDYAGGERGVCLEEVAGGYQLRTKLDNAGWIKKMVKARPFRLSGPALEVLSIIAYKQPLIKAEIDQIRGVESGHLVRALMEKHLVKFAGKSENPGKPMLYGTTKQFLELFGLRNIRELPTLSEKDKLIPDGIGEISEIEGETLGALADKIGLPMGKSYSESEAELLSITDALGTISTSTEFFEQEKVREKQRRDEERAQDLRERQIVGETLPEVDAKWLARFEAKVEAAIKEKIDAGAMVQVVTESQAHAEVEAGIVTEPGAGSGSAFLAETELTTPQSPEMTCEPEGEV